MSSKERRAENERKYEADYAKRVEEEHRKRNLSMYERIEELSSWEDIKDILHRLDDRLDELEKE